MKGFILSILIFVLYVGSSALLSHVLRPRKHVYLFFPSVLAWTPIYFLAYALTPATLGFLPRAWMADLPWVDAFLGYAIFLMNCHSFIDFFFACNGGFSMSVMLELLRRGESGMSTEDVVEGFRAPDGSDKIYGWRLPRMAETGYILIDEAGMCTLTSKGRAIARVIRLLKQALNLGAGG